MNCWVFLSSFKLQQISIIRLQRVFKKSIKALKTETVLSLVQQFMSILMVNGFIISQNRMTLDPKNLHLWFAGGQFERQNCYEVKKYRTNM